MKHTIAKKTAIVLSALTALSAMPLIPASAAQEAFPYAMFAGSDADGAITIDSGWFNMNGSIAANGSIVSSGWMNLSGTKTEYAGMDMIYAGEQLTAQYFSTAEAVDALELEDTNVFVYTPYDVAGSVSLNGNVNLNAAVKADGDIHIDGGVLNSNNAVLFSEAGDIVLDSSGVNFNGILYAPIGNVEINADWVNLNNTIIIADTITIHSYNTNANYGASYASVIGTESGTRASYIAKYNSSIMERDIRRTLDLMSEYYTLTPVDTGSYGSMNIMGMMQFDVQQYDVEGIGNLSIMKAEGMAQMTTYVLTPYDKDLPLISLDYMYNGENRISYVEYYDLTTQKDSAEYQGVLSNLSTLYDKYATLTDTPVSSAWYDDLRTVGLFKASDFRSDAVTSQMLYDSIELTLQSAQNVHDLDAQEKAAKFAETQQYANNLVDIGGIATNMFKMAMGADATKDFFNTVFFGTSRHQPEE